MGLFDNLFGRKPKRPVSDPHRAIAFVDYEHWFYSCKNQFHITPDLTGWRQALEAEFAIEDILVFGDFSNRSIAETLNDVRAITNHVISTQQGTLYHKKNMTDFIMLDSIYQTAVDRPEIGSYILFTGDGHFQSVVKYLKQRMNKRVIIYGITRSISGRLRDVADEVREVPTTTSVIRSRFQMIVDNLAYVAQHDEIIPSFHGTVTAVARRNQVEEAEITAALQQMLDEGLVTRKDRRVAFNKTVKVISPNWDALIAAGYWKP